jgi:peptidyl-dipeptidase A
VSEVDACIQATVEAIQPLYRAVNQAEWEAALAGTPENNGRQQAAQAAYMRFWADPGRYADLKRLLESGAATDPIQARQLKVLYLEAAENQQDEATIQKLTELEAAVRDRHYNFRAQLRGDTLNDNQLDDLLLHSSDSGLVQAAWEASKQIGAQVADQVRELARVRNAAARRQGFRDFFERSLVLKEIEETELFRIFGQLEVATAQPFAALKREIERARAAFFGLPEQALGPWHYGDKFFQEPPPMGAVDFDRLFAGQDPVALALATFDGLGLEVRDVLERSDLYARPGKNQHAFCIDIDREGDVRTLCNLEPNTRSSATLLHELGHAVYDKYLNRSQPWAVRTPPHMLSTEAIALLMGALTTNAEWLVEILGVPAGDAARISQAARARERAARLIFTRWVLVMTNFERALYADPDGDLDTIWWDLVERYQGLRRPAGRQAHDWASKIHIALYPVYYHSYELGYLVTAQLEHTLRQAAGGLVNRPAAGRWLVDSYFQPGNRVDWASHIAGATGEPLNVARFAETLAD